MNEFTAKKLGEVLAFSRIGAETMEKGGEGFRIIFGDSLADLKTSNTDHADSIGKIAQLKGTSEIVLKKFEATGAKLRAMRDLYISDPDDWKNPSEILEWLGFFEGAAVVHWKLVQGASETLGIEDLKLLAAGAISFHESMLEAAGAKLAEIGAEKARS